MSINAININVQKSSANTIHSKKLNVNAEKKDDNKKQISQQKNMSADEIFTYLSATNTTIIKKNSNSDKQRISNSIKDFENLFTSKFNTVKTEFANISDDVAQKIALSMF
ncbi:hypothetical protein IJG72_04415 [bacterium]|nr:hypothetical protein [bacterium]